MSTTYYVRKKLSKEEVYSSATWWEQRSKTPVADIEQKLKYVRDYFADIWGIDIDKLRDIVLRRTAEVKDMDLRILPD